MPRIAREFLDERNAKAVLQLLKMIETRANCSVPELCRKLHVIFPATKPRALERSWRKWSDVRPDARTMPEIKSLGAIVRFALVRGWIDDKVPRQLQVLIEVTEEYLRVNAKPLHMKVVKKLSNVSAELGTISYTTNGSYEAAVEEVLIANADSLVESIEKWWDVDDFDSARKFQAAIDSGKNYMNKRLAEIMLRIQTSDRESKEFFELVASGQLGRDEMNEAMEEDVPRRFGAKLFKRKPD